MKITITIAMLCLISTVAQAKVSFKDCSISKQRILHQANEDGIQALLELQDEFDEHVDSMEFSQHEAKQLKIVAKMIPCILKKMPNMRYSCQNKHHKIKAADTIMWVGRGARIFDGTFNSPSYVKGILVHEVAHKCGANDRNYYYQAGISPNRDANEAWAKTASTYDYWIMKGFCVPGRNC